MTIPEPATVLVTGAAGFIGASCVYALKRQGYAVVAVDHSHGDVIDGAFWASLPRAQHVVHLAARSFVPDSWRASADFYATNVVGAARAADYCARYRAHLVIVSGYVYGQPMRLPINETHAVHPNNPYALSKFLSENVCVLHGETQNLPVTVVRPFNIFGPRQRREFLIPKIVEQIKSAKEIRVKDLAPRRDYLFVDDLADGICRTVSEPRGIRLFNFGSGYSLSVAEIIGLAQDVAGSRLPVFSENEVRQSEIDDVVADIKSANVALGWKPRHDVKDGLRLMFEAPLPALQ